MSQLLRLRELAPSSLCSHAAATDWFRREPIETWRSPHFDPVSGIALPRPTGNSPKPLLWYHGKKAPNES
ncbi:hypothetical protein CSUB01_05382 [Colletotrichum sublineola]|uniref:Uncharacterized protein n=1 Tax=Colletotrichum sublineola TaxID=1173701 RepID=A0A066XIU9_COLSU|nr:hypothetical protein CSUB01_05382 [Colletotrichum sublineola]